jgi:hypothetical protein
MFLGLEHKYETEVADQPASDEWFRTKRDQVLLVVRAEVRGLVGY